MCEWRKLTLSDSSMEYEILHCTWPIFFVLQLPSGSCPGGHVVSYCRLFCWFVIFGWTCLFGVLFVLDFVLWADVLWFGGNDFIWVGLFGVSGWVMFQSCWGCVRVVVWRLVCLSSADLPLLLWFECGWKVCWFAVCVLGPGWCSISVCGLVVVGICSCWCSVVSLLSI